MAGLDLAKVVSRASSPTTGPRPSGRWARATARRPTPKFHVVAFDYGVKRNILRMLAERGCKVTVVPAQTPAAEVLELQARRHLPVQRPRRSGALRLRDRRDARTDRARHPDLRHLPRATRSWRWPPARKTFKMKFGHHGANHPVQGPRQRPGHDHQPEPRLRGRREDAAGEPARHARLAVRRHAAGPGAHRQAGVLLPGPPGSLARARTTSATCSTASSALMEQAAEKN